MMRFGFTISIFVTIVVIIILIFLPVVLRRSNQPVFLTDRIGNKVLQLLVLLLASHLNTTILHDSSVLMNCYLEKLFRFLSSILFNYFLTNSKVTL